VQKAIRCSNTVTHRRARIIALAEGGQRVVQGLVELLHQSPRALGFETGRWTLRDLAAAAPTSGLMLSISPASVWRLLLSDGYSGKQSKRRMSSPDPQYDEKKGRSSRPPRGWRPSLRGLWSTKTKAGLWARPMVVGAGASAAGPPGFRLSAPRKGRRCS